MAVGQGRWRRFSHLPDGLPRFKRLRNNLGSYLVPRDCEGGVCIDLGANVGSFSERYVATFAKILAVEANPHLFSGLYRRLSCYSNIQVISAAVSGKNGALVGLYRHNPRHWDSGSVAVANEHITEAEWSSRPFGVAVSTTLPELIEYMGGVVDYLKIDVETSEYSIIYGQDLTAVRYNGMEMSWQLGADGWDRLLDFIIETHIPISSDLNWERGRNKDLLFERR